MTISKKIKKEILQNPHLILDDHEIMNALLSLKKTNTNNIVDIRDIFIKKLENELKDIRKKYSEFLKTIVENTKSIDAINESILILLNKKNIDDFLSALEKKVKKLLVVEDIKIFFIKKRNSFDNYENLKFYLNEETILSLYDIPQDIKKKPIQREKVKTNKDRKEVLGSEIIILLKSFKNKPNGFLVLSSTDKNQFNPKKDSNFLLFFSKILSILIEKLLD